MNVYMSKNICLSVIFLALLSQHTFWGSEVNGISDANRSFCMEGLLDRSELHAALDINPDIELGRIFFFSLALDREFACIDPLFSWFITQICSLS